ncbi:hypothetical protein RF11_12127 [Thelohanellus kitauei]|uniref:Uncharacterized protein n=1 Tax=Thelohanellus kitauei TaxID=669202 RepID=A0A0C2LZY0_THEKT|nr:hypothetical protein RF11_12127 [Thelohanellus kitauei]
MSFRSVLFLLIGLYFANSTFYDEKRAYKLYEEWNKNEQDYDPEDDKDDEMTSTSLEDRKKRGIGSKMAVIYLGEDIEMEETERISKIWERRLVNMYIPINRFVVNKKTIVLSMKETSRLKKFITFFHKQKDCKTFVIDQVTYDCGTIEEDQDL